MKCYCQEPISSWGCLTYASGQEEPPLVEQVDLLAVPELLTVCLTVCALCTCLEYTAALNTGNTRYCDLC